MRCSSGPDPKSPSNATAPAGACGKRRSASANASILVSPMHLRASSSRANCEPMNPPAPVTRTLMSFLEDGDGAGPACGRTADLVREAADREAVAGQGLKVVQLLEVAIADVAPGLVAFPDQGLVAGL